MFLPVAYANMKAAISYRLDNVIHIIRLHFINTQGVRSQLA